VTRAQALKLAVEALRKQAKLLAVEANLRADYGASYPAARRAYEERRRLLEAVEVLENDKCE
jgi:ABC-type transporter lipoprotein component MlaA